jgi:hypothetical protein
MANKKGLIIGIVSLLIIMGVVIAIGLSQSNNASNTNKSTSSQKKITATELATHNTSSNCYISLNNEVYDITSFIPKHEGGSEIVEECGKVVDDFSSIHPGGSLESVKVQKQISNLKIGILEG